MANWTSNEYVNALLVGAKHQSNFLSYRFDNTGSGGAWSTIEKNAFIDALDSWSSVANLTFTQTTSSNADLTESLYFSSQQGDLGVHGLIIDYDSPTIVQHNVNLSGEYNTNGFGWDDSSNGGLSVGGFGYATLVHEIGHALGLDHSHSDGCCCSQCADPHEFPGVSNSSDSGSNQLNQDVYTIMSYVSGEISRPLISGEVYNYGYMAGPMAFDIAAIQYLYGAKANQNSGDDVYYLPTSNVFGTFFEAIWDTGGVDTIEYTGSIDATIDLRSATLQNEVGGGGFVSSADGIYGGFTIAADFTNAISNSGGETGVIIENATGGSGNDVLTGNAVANELRGNAGDDILNGGSGNDTLDGGLGGDTLDGGSNGLVGDTVTYANSNGAVNVRLLQDTATGGHANGDELDNIENLIGSVHNDILFGDVQDNDLQGGDGDDNLNGSNGDDTLNGGADDDRLTGGQGADDLDGGDGTGDEARYATSNDAVFINLAADTATGGHADGDELDNIENLFGSGFGDTLTGDSQANRLDGFNGNDTLIGGDGADFLFGGTGSDTADYTDSGMTAVTVKLNTFSGVGGTAEGDELRAIENVIGSAAGDTINGSTGTNTLTGAGGDDTLNGLNGNDFLYGGNNDDTLIGGRGGDLIDGGDGIDTARYANSDGLIRIDLGAGTTGGAGHAFNDTLVDIENIFGSAFNDVITGDDGINDLNGYNGNDRLNGGLGDDVLTGGSGNDRFVFTDLAFGQDTITDFTNGQDKLDFTALGLTASDFTITQVGNDTLMTLNSDTNQTIVLEDTTATTIDNGDFF